jgi:MFS family permease
MFLAGLGGFTVASLACGLAPTAPVLVIARIAAGAAAASLASAISSDRASWSRMRCLPATAAKQRPLLVAADQVAEPSALPYGNAPTCRLALRSRCLALRSTRPVYRAALR